MTSLVCMAEIVGVHGIKGVVKLKVFGSDPLSLAGQDGFSDAAGKKLFLTLASVAQHGNIWLAEINGISDRTAAEKLRGVKLHLPRAELPQIKKKDTYYHADLIGLTAKFPDGKIMGKVIAVANFGAGDLLEIKPLKGASFYAPFTNAVVPEVNIGEKTLTVDPPEGLMG